MFNTNFFALIIGIDYYDNSKVKNLSKATKDSEDLYNYLISSGGYSQENVVILTNHEANKTNINKKISELKNKIGNNDTFIFYFSGHGSSLNDDFILPLCDYDEKDNNTYLNDQELNSVFSDINARNVLFLFDTCYSGLLAKRDSETDKKKQLLKLVEDEFHNSRVLIASSLPNQPSWELLKIDNGVFTHCLLEALQGGCSVEQNDKIYIFDLLKFLVKNVKEVANENQISQDCCIKTSLLFEDFPICFTQKKYKNSSQLPTRYLNTVVDWQEDIDELFKKFAEGLKRRSIDSKFTYWGENVTKKYIELLETNEYSLPKSTIKLLSSKIDKIANRIIAGRKSLRVVSLGIGDGHKDAIILNELCKKLDNYIDYWIVEFSYDMAKEGIKNIKKDLGEDRFNQISPKLFQIDFLDIAILSKLMKDDRTNLFLLLGNTLGNFPEDLLLDSINSVMRSEDFFLIDNQIKGENKLTLRERTALEQMYNTDKYKDYIYSILKNARIQRTDGEIKTKVTDDTNSTNVTLRKYNCATVTQEFIFSKNKEVKLGGIDVKFTHDTIIPVIYSRKYTRAALNALLRNYFEIVNGPYYSEGKYALILAQKN